MNLDDLLAENDEEAGRSGPAGPKVFSVVEISVRIKGVLENSFNRVPVEGEVTGLKSAASGHVYFSLAERDARGTTHKLDCVVYRFTGAARSGLSFREGDRIVATGRITAWGGASRYQMSVDSVRQAGAGDLLRRLEELKSRLAGEGLFEPSRKRPLPFMPRRIGVVTSIRGAAIRDIVRTIMLRYPADILVVDTLVQGDGAAEGIARGIEMLNRVRDVDVIIVGRGGGSMEDLWAFNEEIAVRAVAASGKPVVSAVGHEIDHVLTDDAADARAATPTAAAQMVVPSMDELVRSIDDSAARMKMAVTRQLDESSQVLDELLERLQRSSARWADARNRRLDMLGARLAAAHPARRLADKARHLDVARSRLESAGRRLLERPETRLERMMLRLESFNPKTPLLRGFSIARKADGTIVRNYDDVLPGDIVDVTLKNGVIDCTVNAARPAGSE